MHSLGQGVSPLRSIRIHDELWDKLQAVCRHEGMTASRVIRMAASTFVARYPHINPRPKGEGGFYGSWYYTCRDCGADVDTSGFDAALDEYETHDGRCGNCSPRG